MLLFEPIVCDRTLPILPYLCPTLLNSVGPSSRYRSQIAYGVYQTAGHSTIGGGDRIGAAAPLLFMLKLLVVQEGFVLHEVRQIPPMRRLTRPRDASDSAVPSLTACSQLSLCVLSRRPTLSQAIGRRRERRRRAARLRWLLASTSARTCAA